MEHYDTVRRRKDGTLVDVSLTISPIKNNEGKSSAHPPSPTILPTANVQKNRFGRARSGWPISSITPRRCIYTMSLDGVLTFVSPVWTQNAWA